jgi:hypothetical protein
MSRKWNEPCPKEMKFIESFLYVKGKSTKKEIEKEWCNSSHWNGKEYTATLHHSLMSLRKDGTVLTDDMNTPFGFSLV